MKTKILSFKDVDISKIELKEEEKTKHISELIAPVLINALIHYINQQKGLFKAERALFYSVGPKLEEAGKNKAESIEITDEELGFVRKCFRETKLTPTSLLEPVEKYIDDLVR